jgi:hypothetical protein
MGSTRASTGGKSDYGLPREDIDHEVFLEPSVLAEFLAWARRVGATQEPGSPSGQDEEA